MVCVGVFFVQAEDGIRCLVRSRGLGDVYKRQALCCNRMSSSKPRRGKANPNFRKLQARIVGKSLLCLLYTSDAADERSSVDLGGRRIIKKKNIIRIGGRQKRKNEILNYHNQQI